MTTAAPVVAHLMRAHPANSETFVHNRVTALRRYRPVVAAHHRRPQTSFQLGEGMIAAQRLPASLARLQTLAYRTTRVRCHPAPTPASSCVSSAAPACRRCARARQVLPAPAV